MVISYNSSPSPTSESVSPVSSPYGSGSNFAPVTPIPQTTASSSLHGTPIRGSRSWDTSSPTFSTDGSVSSASTSSSYPESSSGEHSPSGLTYSPTNATKSFDSLSSPTWPESPPSPPNQYNSAQQVSPIGRSIFGTGHRDSYLTTGHMSLYRSESATGISRSYPSFDHTSDTRENSDLSPIRTGLSYQASNLPSKTVHPSSIYSVGNTAHSFYQ